MELVVRDEDSLWSAIEQAVAGGFDRGDTLRFDGWPRLEIVLRGDKFRQTLTPDVMKGLVDFQSRLERSYAYLLYGERNARRLKKEEKADLQYLVKVENGSSFLGLNLTEVLQHVADRSVGRMNGNQVLAGVLAISALIGAYSVWQAWLDHERALREMDHQEALEDKETERLSMLARIIADDRGLQEVGDDLEDGRRNMIRHFSEAESADIAGQRLEHDEINEIGSKPRAETFYLRVDGAYRVEEANFRDSENTKLFLVRQSDGKAFSATYSVAELGIDQSRKLQEAVFARTPIELKIFGVERRGKITQATIVGVGEVPGEDNIHD